MTKTKTKTSKAKPKTNELRLAYVPLDTVRLWDKNPKKHDIEQLTESIYRYGFQDPAKFDETLGGLVFGNGRTEALRLAKQAGKQPPKGILIDKEGRWCVPVLFGNDLASTQAASAFAIDHNNLTMAGSHSPKEMALMWTAEGYQAIMQSLKSANEMPITAWMPKENLPEDPGAKIDQAAELLKKWKVKPGELWEIGRHRLLCGDSTKREDAMKLMQGEKADMVFTDPPYGVSYIGENNPNGREWEPLKNDNLRGEKLYKFLKAAFENLYWATKEDIALYCWHASSTQREFENALNDAKFEVKQQLIWNKGMVLGHSDYHWAHEPLFYCKKKGQSTSWYGDRTGKTILGERRSQFENMTKEKLIKILAVMMDTSSTWEIDRDSVVQYQHSTQKPSRLAALAITNSTSEGQTIVDFFHGSGSTMVAAQILDRRCLAIEIEPKFVAVALERLSEMGTKPKPITTKGKR